MSHVKAHIDSHAAAGARAMEAEAYATGDHVAFAGTPSLHTAAHEAAHVIQQRTGVQLQGGVGEAGDPYEQHADAVAAAVVQGRSSEALLDRYAGTVPQLDAHRGIGHRLEQISNGNGPGAGQPPVQRTLMNGTRALQRSRALGTVTNAFQVRFDREPNPVELRELQRLVALYTASTKEIRTVDQVLNEVIANTARGEERTGHAEHVHPPSSARAPVSAEPPEELELSVSGSHPRQEVARDSNIVPGVPGAEVRSDQAEEPAREQGSSASARLAHDVSSEPQLRRDSATHVGFEIEVGGRYTFPSSAAGALGRVLNRTLCECIVDGNVILEMLLDDLRPERSSIQAQVEFRTPPLNFRDINQNLGALIRMAISRFPVGIFSSVEPVQFMISRGRERTTGIWRPTPLLLSERRSLAAGTASSRFAVSSGPLAQHATTSIELDAFSRLPESQQGLLYPAGAGATSKQELLERIARAASGDGSGHVDATTRGRNAAGITVKTPVESLLAADPSLEVPRNNQSAGSVRVSDREEDRYPLGSVSAVAALIRDQGRFPGIQGEGGMGYRAVAEKLQPPLEDTQSGELRVLVEHRSGALQSAVNQALTGNNRELARRANAASAMDRLRINREHVRREPRSGTSLHEAQRSSLPGSSRGRETTITSREVAREPEGSGIPNIADPPAPLSLEAMAAHYAQGILWANTQGTFSNEFFRFRDRGEEVLTILQAGGLDNGAVHHIRHTLPGIIGSYGPAAQGYPQPQMQEAIFDQLDRTHGRTLWAILRYLDQRQGS